MDNEGNKKSAIDLHNTISAEQATILSSDRARH